MALMSNSTCRSLDGQPGKEPGHRRANPRGTAGLLDPYHHRRVLAAIGIAGMDRALRANILAKSGKAVEVAGDVDTLLLDKTGTITVGNRHATRFIPLGDQMPAQLAYLTALPLRPTRPPRERVSSRCITSCTMHKRQSRKSTTAA